MCSDESRAAAGALICEDPLHVRDRLDQIGQPLRREMDRDIGDPGDIAARFGSNDPHVLRRDRLMSPVLFLASI